MTLGARLRGFVPSAIVRVALACHGFPGSWEIYLRKLSGGISSIESIQAEQVAVRDFPICRPFSLNAASLLHNFRLLGSAF